MTQRSGVADEAGRLLLAVEHWLRGAAGEPPSPSGAPNVVRDLFAHPGPAHQSDSSCEICPLCRAITAVRTARPDIVEHLVEAAGSMLLALRALAEPRAENPVADDEPAEQRSTVVQHISVN